jgi:hypothetical protein
MTEATWVNGPQKVTGRWAYRWASDRFYISLDRVDRITGQKKQIVVCGDRPEWGRWKLLPIKNLDERIVKQDGVMRATGCAGTGV